MDFGRFLDTAYISSFRGSTAQDLLAAAREIGLDARFEVALDSASLREANGPMLLLCDLSRPAEGSFHWLTFLGDRDGQAYIFDAPREMQLVPYAQVMSVWTGSAIILGRKNRQNTQESSAWLNQGGSQDQASHLDLPRLALSARWRAINRLWPAVLFCSVLIMAERRLRGVPLGWQILVVLTFAGTWVAGICLLDRDQPMFQRPVAEYLRCRGERREVPHVLEIVGETAIVDARLPFAYGLGHIPGAVNIPIDASLSEWIEAVAKLDRRKPVVVYCQSAQCGWADRLASQLVCTGVPASVLQGGYESFRRRELEAASNGVLDANYADSVDHQKNYP